MTTYLDPHHTVRHRRRPAGVTGPDPDGDGGARAGAAGRHRARPVAGRAPRQYGDLPRLGPRRAARPGRPGRLRGRGGAAFPFATKLEAAAPRPPAGRGREPERGRAGQRKDAALALTRPHLVLDGAVATARALHARELHVVLPGERPAAAAAMRTALAERDDRVPVHSHVAAPRFVAGQAKAVVELLVRPAEPAGHELAARGGRRAPGPADAAEQRRDLGPGRAAGAARRAAYAAVGTRDEPGATLLTLSRPGADPLVGEAAYGDRLRDDLPARATGGRR